MPHIHSMTIFGADRIEIKFEPQTRSYSITLSSGEWLLETTRINIWRDANNGRAPELIVEGQPVHTTLESAT
jgi:hypothetical protein